MGKMKDRKIKLPQFLIFGNATLIEEYIGKEQIPNYYARLSLSIECRRGGAEPVKVDVPVSKGTYDALRDKLNYFKSKKTLLESQGYLELFVSPS